MDHSHAEMRSSNGGHRPPGRSLRAPGGGVPSGPAPPLKVYCVEPRDFRELVQRLTGARSAAGPPAPAPAPAAMPAPAASQSSSGRFVMDAAAGQFDYSPWFSAPLFSPAYAPGAGFDGKQGRL